jgi:D-inositol-3-phosphate glycosyltransferase
MINDQNGVLGLLFPQVAKESLVRNPSGSFTEKLQTYIASKLFPDILAVRGNLVAIDYLTEALLRYGTMSRYEIFVEPSFVEKAKAFVNLRGKNAPGSDCNITSLLDVLGGIDGHGLTAFFNPSGNFSQPLVMRNKFSSKLYPVTTLTHGFSMHSMLYDGFLKLLLEGTYPFDSLICTSRASRAAMTNILERVGEQFNRKFHASIEYAGRLDVIPLCIDTAKFRPQDKLPLRKTLRLPAQSIILLYLGYISALKADLLPLLSVYRRLIQANPQRQLIFVIAGTKDSSYAATIGKFVQDFGLGKHVRIVDGMTDETKYAITAAADIFVSPGDSIQESFGLTPIEAMACGVPQVVADWDGYRDTVAHGETGFLVPTYWAKCDSDLVDTGALMGWEFDHLALGQSVALDLNAQQHYLQLLIENESLRREMSIRSRERAETLFSFPAVVKQYEDLWRELALRARGVSHRTIENNVAAPHYFEFFKNHAACIVGDETGLSITSSGCEAADKDLLSLLHTKISICKTIDPRLVRLTLDVLMAVSSGPEDGAANRLFRFGDVVEAVNRDRAFHPDYVRRNIMWLIKQGFVSCNTSGARTQGARDEAFSAAG